MWTTLLYCYFYQTFQYKVATAIVSADTLVKPTLNMLGSDGVGHSADDYFH